MDRHTVTVQLADDSVPVDGVVKALFDAGFAVGKPALVEPPKSK